MAILQSVMQRISRNPAPAPLVQQTQALASKIQDLAPLYGLQQQRKLVDVICQRSGTRYQSLILAIDLAAGHLELDELFPAVGFDRHLAGAEFKVEYHQGGEILAFDVSLLSISNHQNPLYYFSLPDTIGVSQRRKQARINLSRRQPLAVKLLSPSSERWYSTAHNLSTGGMRLVIGGNILDQLQRNTRLRSCEFKFNEDFQIRCEAQVKSFRFNRTPYRQTEVSIEFLHMPAPQEYQLGQLIDSYFRGSRAA